MSSSRTVFVQFLTIVVAIVTLLVALGWVPTARSGGQAATTAMMIGCAISLLGSVAGAVPALMATSRPPADRLPAIFAAMGVRLAVVVVLAVVIAVMDLVPARPLLVWVAISHAVLLIPDSVLAVRLTAQKNDSARETWAK